MWEKSKITQLLRISYPIVQAGMAGGVTTPELIAAVSNAGGLGSLGAGYLTSQQMNHQIRRIKSMTDRPFAVNVFIPETPEVLDEEFEQAWTHLGPIREHLHMEERKEKPEMENRLDEQLEVVLREKVPVCSFTFGLPSQEIIQKLKDNGTIVMGTSTTVEEAVMNQSLGVDCVVAQGSEAGGHRGTFLQAYQDGMVGTMSLVPQVVDAISIPVLAAGGIMDGRGVKAALALGAEGVQMGTAFVTCHESGANEAHKQAILHASEHETVVTSVFSGKPARGIQNRFIEEMGEVDVPGYPFQHALTKGIRKKAASQQNADWMSLWSGQSPKLSKRVSAEGIVRGIVAQMEE